MSGLESGIGAGMGDNFFWLIKHAYVRDPSRLALLVPGRGRFSYADLDELSARYAGVLRKLAVTVGDRVLVQVDKSPEAVALYLGCLRMGAVYVPINTAYTQAEVDYFLGDAKPAVFVCRAEDESRFQDRAEASADFPKVLSLAVDGGGSFVDAVESAAPQDAFHDIVPCDGSDLAAILYTSGTTGKSKGAMLSHSNLATNSVTLVDYWGWQESDVLLHALPIFHVHGLFIALHCAMLKASTIIFLQRFDVEQVIEHLPRASVMMGVPTFYSRLLAHNKFDRELCAGMRLFISGSAPLTTQTFEVFEERTGHRILERYGMSETMMNTSNPLVGERVPGTVGFALPGVQARIASTTGDQLAPGEVGIIEVKGPNVFQGYWQMPEKTAQEFRDDGFFITGDLATMNERGRFTIVGREKDLVITGGFNVYPKEVEALIDELAEVRESAVIGVPHEDFGEAVVAVVVPVAGDVELSTLDAAMAGQIARFKQPKRVINVPELPRNAMGKVQKNLLREAHARLFSEVEVPGT